MQTLPDWKKSLEKRGKHDCQKRVEMDESRVAERSICCVLVTLAIKNDATRPSPCFSSRLCLSSTCLMLRSIR